MPARNSQKLYVADTWYHVYNRGVEKRIIFLDSQDYGVFCSYLKEYLSVKDEAQLYSNLADTNTSTSTKDSILKALRLNNFVDEIILGAYSLMPNHFHFLIKQRNVESMDRFMSSISTRYAMYFNRKYKRVGSLYQGVYKAVLVETDEQLLQLSRYIHRNGLSLQGETLQTLSGQPSSYAEYLGMRQTSWVHSAEILSFFSKTNPSLSYETFVTQAEDMELIAQVTIDGE